MSGYWEAVGRAAIGKPGTAGPRPRSRFEPGAGLGPEDAFGAIKIEADPAAPSGTPTVTQHEASRPIYLAKDHERPLSSQEQRKVAEDAPYAAGTDGRQLTAAAASAETRSEPSTQKAVTNVPFALPRVPIPEPVAPIATRVEVHRIETTRTVIETREVDDRTTAAATAAPPLENDGPSGTPPTIGEPPPEQPQIATPVLLAERLAPPPEAVEPAPKAPPLVIEIDRIDIRIAPEALAAPSPPRRSESGTGMTLADYLARRSERWR